MSDFSKRLREQREELSLSQSALAKSVGVHHSIIGRYERDEAKPTSDVLVRLAKALNTTVGYLVGEDSHAALFKDPSMVQRFKDILELPDEDRTALLRNLDAFLRDAKARMAYQ
jgi:transcriptional regulator with XRE-family HTH domain